MDIENEFLGFLEGVSVRKPGESFAHYHSVLGFLIFLFPECEAGLWSNVVDKGAIGPYRFILVSRRTQRAAGVKSTCGMQTLLSYHYFHTLPATEYARFSERHNIMECRLSVADILSIEDRYCPPNHEQKERRKMYREGLEKGLASSGTVSLHIPLLSLEKAKNIRFSETVH